MARGGSQCSSNDAKQEEEKGRTRELERGTLHSSLALEVVSLRRPMRRNRDGATKQKGEWVSLCVKRRRA